MAIIFVNLKAKGINNGSSWNDAYTNLQTAISNAQTGDEIWVAKGTYRPTSGTDRTVSFVLKNGVKMYGGFSGDETSISQRDLKNNITELSGDLGTQGNNSDNTYHVVDISNTTGSSVLDGFSITNGNAEVYTQRNGGGIYSNQSSAILSNLIIADNRAQYGGGIYSINSQLEISKVLFQGNYAEEDGGGIYNNSSSPTILDVTFNSNYAASEGGAIHNYDHSNSFITNTTFNANYAKLGGAIYNIYNSNPTLTGVSFLSNAAYEGGGIYSRYNSNPTVEQAVFKNNAARNSGAGIYNNGSNNSTVVANSLFEGNISPYGAGVYNDSSAATVVNSTFTKNQSLFGAAIRTRGTQLPSVTNSIFWHNNSIVDGSIIANQANSNANTVISNSIVEGGYSGSNIIDLDPQFIAPELLDYRLKNNSPGIDAGSNDLIADYDLDLAGNPRIISDTVDLGAYESSEGDKGDADTVTSLGESVVIYVDSNATGDNNGISWANAYTDLQDAIASAPFGSQIWVAEGTYKPTTQVGEEARKFSFKLNNGVAIYGGFAGSEAELNQRNVENNLTILSGDINTIGNNSDNSHHVVVTNYTTNSAVLDGFTIQDGNANVYDYNTGSHHGGGIYAYQSQAVFANLIIQNNNASYNGGGVFTYEGLNQFSNVSFLNNIAENHGGALYSDGSSILKDTTFKNNIARNNGGAIYNEDILIIDKAGFSNNIAQDNGGAIYNYYQSQFNLIDTVFSSNRATDHGGAIYNYEVNSDYTSSTITNTVFNGNTGKLGGAIFNYGSDTVGTNLTFAKNKAQSGAAIYSQGDSKDQPTYRNSIFWVNEGISSNSPIVNSGANTIVANSIVSGGYNGLGIINEDPKFADSASRDFRLQTDSPAIDSGLNDFVVEDQDLIGSDRIIGNTVDMGAYEYFAEQDLSANSGTIGNSDILVLDPDISDNTKDNFALEEIHRFFHTQKGFHLYTSDAKEIDYVREKSAAGELNYRYEAEQYTVLSSDKDKITGETIEGTKPVYRFYNLNTGAHLYTMQEKEKNYIIDNFSDYSFEGIKYYAFESQPEEIATVPVYRMRNSSTGTHLFTINQKEVNFIQNNLPDYNFEGNKGGVVFHVFDLEA